MEVTSIRFKKTKAMLLLILLPSLVYDANYYSSEQRIATSTREGGPALERYVEALACHSAKLTYSALSGARKQSVQDAERMFSTDMVDFMKSKGYDFEAAYISVIGNWHQSCDQRGLSQLQRCRYNHQLLMYITDDLMPL